MFLWRKGTLCAFRVVELVHQRAFPLYNTPSRMLFAVMTVQMCQNVPFLRKSCSRSSQNVPQKKASARPDG